MADKQVIPDDRAKLLEAIRTALRPPTVRAAHAGHPATSSPVSTAGMPQVDNHWAAMLANFTARCADLRAELVVVNGPAEMTAAVQAIAQKTSATKIAYHDDARVVPVVDALKLPAVKTDGGYDKSELAACDLGLTGCFALIAQTGSVMVASSTDGGRALSVLPPHHVVLADAGKLVRDLSTAYALFADSPVRPRTSMISLISGPSRTGDIERILVLGAHGPKRLTIILDCEGAQALPASAAAQTF